MSKFDAKTWNPNVFEKYMSKVPNVKENSLIKNGLLESKPNMTARLRDEVGGNYFTEPMYGLLDGDVINYDGVSDITATSRSTFEQGKIIIGRAKAWAEKDFSRELTGIDWIETVAGEVKEYYDAVDQATILSILKGIFNMTDTAGNDFVAKHSTEITTNLSATSMNSALQKACGDKKKAFKIAFMNSVVATNLENLQLLEYLKYTDSEGIQRDLTIATYNGKLVVVDDEMPVEVVPATYAITSDVAIDDEKTYYTRSGSAGAYVYTAVASPLVANIATYYERTAESYNKYTTYVLGEKFFGFDNVGVRVSNEMVRDALTNGGIETLVTRQRKLYVPKYISFTKSSMATSSPTDAELQNGANWEVVNDGASSKTYVNHKMIPLAKIVSRG